MAPPDAGGMNTMNDVCRLRLLLMQRWLRLQFQHFFLFFRFLHNSSHAFNACVMNMKSKKKNWIYSSAMSTLMCFDLFHHFRIDLNMNENKNFNSYQWTADMWGSFWWGAIVGWYIKKNPLLNVAATMSPNNAKAFFPFYFF